MASTTQDNGVQSFPFDNSMARLRYFLGQVLSQRDLQLEQSYHLTLQRLAQREMFGTGTVAGLELTIASSAGGTAPDNIYVQPGLAFDSDGRELVLEREVSIRVAEPLVVPTPETFPEPITTDAELAAAVVLRFLGTGLDAFNANELQLLRGELTSIGFFTSTPTLQQMREALEQIPVPEAAELPVAVPPQTLREWLFDQLVGTSYVGIRFREAGSDPMPANLDASCCGDRVCFNSRTQQGVALAVSLTPFPALVDPYVQVKVALDAQLLAQLQSGSTPEQVDCRAALCAALVQVQPDGASPWRGLPVVAFRCEETSLPIVPLGRVHWRRFADGEPQFLDVDNCSFRPLAPGLPALRALVEALTSCAAPTLLAPRFIAITPADGAQIFAADTESGFEILIRATGRLRVQSGGDLQKIWQMDFYPATAPGSIQSFPTSTGTGPSGTTVTVTLENPGSDNGTDIRITFSGGTGAFTAGTYVWRIPNSGSTIPALVSDGTNVRLDGDPNPPAAVPSGDGIAGGQFEARFFVRG